jgi:hypothetical protein
MGESSQGIAANRDSENDSPGSRCEAHHVGIDASEDRRCSEIEVGEVEGGAQEGGLEPRKPAAKCGKPQSSKPRDSRPNKTLPLNIICNSLNSTLQRGLARLHVSDTDWHPMVFWVLS